ncbi:MAG: hypothetical protein CVU11_09625 [Bacteroidetes bacterium HGW-Bacteroidetes-6]|jgi:hypothetical protein|nr:MAG: hypothetical protein CVU11_09625 [Bacteroidetes bacterium HGW-Bacteroidetes-6]
MNRFLYQIRYCVLKVLLLLRNSSSIRRQFLLAGVSLLVISSCKNGSSEKSVSASQLNLKSLALKLQLIDTIAIGEQNIFTDKQLSDEKLIESSTDTAIIRPPDVMCYAPLPLKPE